MKVIALAGSTRKDSINRHLLNLTLSIVQKKGADVDHLLLKEYPLPFYDADLETASGLPENAKIIRQKFIDCDAVIVASPEYNGSVTGVLKNLIDWTSRGERAEGKPKAYQDKPFLILSASPGPGGGQHSINQLRHILTVLKGNVLEEAFSLPKALKAYGEDGHFINESDKQRLELVVNQLFEGEYV